MLRTFCITFAVCFTIAVVFGDFLNYVWPTEGDSIYLTQKQAYRDATGLALLRVAWRWFEKRAKKKEDKELL